jgi:hypothetical protein
MIPDDPTGIHDGIPEAEYHAHPTSLSVTGAKLMLKAPALFKHRQANPEHRDVFDFGKAAHAKVLGVGSTIRVVDADSWRTKAAQTEKAEARAAGEAPLLTADYERVCAMAAELERLPLVRDLMKDGRPEVSAFCTDEATGVMRRSRFDLLGDLVIDYKTAASAEPEAFGRAAAKYGYHQQAAWYEQIALDLGNPVRGFLFIVQEKTAPYLTSVVELVPEAVARGAELNRIALDRFRDCTQTGNWPGYGDGIHSVDIPIYAYDFDDIEMDVTL